MSHVCAKLALQKSPYQFLGSFSSGSSLLPPSKQISLKITKKLQAGCDFSRSLAWIFILSKVLSVIKGATCYLTLDLFKTISSLSFHCSKAILPSKCVADTSCFVLGSKGNDTNKNYTLCFTGIRFQEHHQKKMWNQLKRAHSLSTNEPIETPWLYHVI